MTASLATAPPSAPTEPVIGVRIAVAPAASAGAVDLVDRPTAGEWGWRLATVILGPLVDRNPDLALTILRTADELVDLGRAWVQRFTEQPVLG